MKNAIIPLAVILVAPLFLVAATSSLEYDPWSDLDASGDIDIFDVVTVAGAYQTTGDPTKDVNVTNWPVSHNVNVWWAASVSQYLPRHTGSYPAAGFGQLHVLVKASDLEADESVRFIIYGCLMNPTGTAYYSIQVYATTLGPTSLSRDLTMPVPSERFWFEATAQDDTSCTIYMSFYLTWS